MNHFLASLVYAAVFTASIKAQDIPAGSSIQFALASNSSVCLGAVAPVDDAHIVLGTCGTPGTTYALDDGTPSVQTRIILGDVLLEVCADAPLERWHVAAGAGEISTAEEEEALCITAPVDGKRGDLVTTQSCTGVPEQQWIVTTVDA
ncbi:unnamed protein product [Peniophora sp. CBMAI 1063]|nr:unnamed protein product [Peniophora sp. CBMAI 1063]